MLREEISCISPMLKHTHITAPSHRGGLTPITTLLCKIIHPTLTALHFVTLESQSTVYFIVSLLKINVNIDVLLFLIRSSILENDHIWTPSCKVITDESTFSCLENTECTISFTINWGEVEQVWLQLVALVYSLMTETFIFVGSSLWFSKWLLKNPE